MTKMSDIERLMAVEEIQLLKARRDRAVDMKDWQTVLSLHTADHQSDHDGHEPWASADEMVRNVQLMLDDKVSVHHSHTPEITFQSPVKAAGIWAVEENIFWKQDGENYWFQGFGFYHETYEKHNGSWLFTSRKVRRTHVQTATGAQSAPIPGR